MTSTTFTALAITITAVSALVITTPRSEAASVSPADACNQKLKTGAATKEIWQPLSGCSITLDRFQGSVYYTIAQDGYRVVATLASGPKDFPIRFVATLAPEQHMAISVPQKPGQPSIDVDIMRTKDTLVVGYANPCVATE